MKTIDELIDLRKELVIDFQIENDFKYKHFVGNEFYYEIVYVSDKYNDFECCGIDTNNARSMDFCYCREMNKFFIYKKEEFNFSITEVVYDIVSIFLHKNRLKHKVVLINPDENDPEEKWIFFLTNNEKLNNYIIDLLDPVIVSKEKKYNEFCIDRYLELPFFARFIL